MYLDKKISVPKKNIYYGWVITTVAAFGLFFSGPGQTYSISVFINSYIKDFGWSRSIVSSVYSMATLLAGLLLFVVGRVLDKYGHRYVSIIVAFLLGLACMWSSFVINPIMLFIGFFMLRLFGQGSMTLMPSTLVSQWFIQKRAFALSLMTLGGVASSAIVPSLNTYFIDSFGWNMAWRFWAILLWCVFIPIAFIFTRNKPEDIGLLPDNRKIASSSNEEIDSGKEKIIKEISWTLQEAMKTRAFWFMMFCQAIPSMITTGVTFHFISILGEKGLSHTLAASVLSIMAVVGFPVTFIAGYILDRVKVHLIIALVFVLELTSLIVLFYAHSPYMAIAFGVICGVFSGLQSICNNIVWVNYYGPKHLGSIRGFTMMAMVIGSAFGPLPFGLAYDIFGGYSQIIIAIMIFPVLGGIAALLSPRPRKKRMAI